MKRGGEHRWHRSGAAFAVAPARRLFSWLCLLLLAANLVGGAALPASAAMGRGVLPGDGVIVVCTAVGMRLVDPTGKTPPVSAAEQGGLCSLCLPLMHGGVAAPAALATAVPVAVAVRGTVAAAHGVEVGQACRRPTSPRAPPLV